MHVVVCRGLCHLVKTVSTAVLFSSGSSTQARPVRCRFPTCGWKRLTFWQPLCRSRSCFFFSLFFFFFLPNVLENTSPVSFQPLKGCILTMCVLMMWLRPPPNDPSLIHSQPVLHITNKSWNFATWAWMYYTNWILGWYVALPCFLRSGHFRDCSNKTMGLKNINKGL